MVTLITPRSGTPIRGIAGLEKLDDAAAKGLLVQIQTQVAGKRGVLKLMHTSSDRDMVFQRKSWYQAIARRDRTMGGTAQALKSLYQQAGLSSNACDKLDAYLRNHNNRVGGTSLARRIQEDLATVAGAGASDSSVARLLPRETNRNFFLRDAIFGSATERRVGCAAQYEGETAEQRTANISNRDEHNAQFQSAYPDVNPHYLIGAGPNAPNRLVGISRSANADGPAFDTTRPIVIFFGGSHGNVADYAYPAAEAAGPEKSGGLNFLAVDYRGFGQSGRARPTPRTVTQDALQVYEHVKSLGFRPDQIILRGYSLGAAAAARVHAVAELKGERLKGVVYDRPMASAAGVAREADGKTAEWATKQSVDRFGADRYLAALQGLGYKEMSNAVVIADNEDDLGLGPLARRMALDRGLLLKNLDGGHADHGLANKAFTEFLGEKLLASNSSGDARLAAGVVTEVVDEALLAPISPGDARLAAGVAVNNAVREWLDSKVGAFETELAAFQRIVDRIDQLTEAEIAMRQANGEDGPDGIDGRVKLLDLTLTKMVENMSTDLTTDRIARWEEKLAKSPLIEVLNRISNRLNDELLATGKTRAQNKKLEDILNLASNAGNVDTIMRSALGLPRLQTIFIDPNPSNTTPDMFRNIDRLFDGTR